jgi:hypothetical protein
MRTLILAQLVLFISMASCGGRATSDLFDSANDAGGTSSSGDGGKVVNPPPLPFDAGKTCAAASGCRVSYQKDITPIFEQACSTGSCHGNTYEPKMPSKDEKLTWTNLSKFRSRAGSMLPYINACSKDPNDSYILDNLGYDKTRPTEAGQRMPLGPPLSKDQIKRVEEWVRCGAPFN